MRLRIKRLDPGARLPEYATEGAACIDIRALHGGRVAPGGHYVFSTGLAFEVPAGHVLLVFSRSGHAFSHDVRLGNGVAVVDSDYRGEVRVKLISSAEVEPLLVKAGDRIAQAMLVPIPRIEVEEAARLSPTARGDAGFGSTGVA